MKPVIVIWEPRGVLAAGPRSRRLIMQLVMMSWRAVFGQRVCGRHRGLRRPDLRPRICGIYEARICSRAH